MYEIRRDFRIINSITSVPTPSSAGALLLDSLSGTALLAYSSRKLRSAYAGSALKVRRSSDDATQDIGFTSNILDTASMAAFVTSNDGFNDTWYNQALAGGNNGTTSGAGRQPKLVSAGTNNTVNGNVAALWSNALGGTYFDVNPAISQPLTVAVCFKLTVNTADRHLTDGSVTRVLIGFDGTPNYQMYAGGTPRAAGTPDTSTHTIIGVFNGASSALYLDGAQIIAPTTCGTDGFNAQYIGAGNGPSALDGYITEFLVFGSAISAGDMSTIRSSWASYWGAP